MVHNSHYQNAAKPPKSKRFWQDAGKEAKVREKEEKK
jgi:hypothetical protein